MLSQIAVRSSGLTEEFRRELVAARKSQGWSQGELGRRLGLPQAHISGIENGKVVPRFDTMLDLVRVLGLDLITVPRALVPAVQAIIRDYRSPEKSPSEEDSERPLYGDFGEPGL